MGIMGGALGRAMWLRAPELLRRCGRLLSEASDLDCERLSPVRYISRIKRLMFFISQRR